MAEPSNRLLRPEELAERWGVPRSQVLRLAREGALACVRVGRYVRFRPESVEAFEREGGAEHAPDERAAWR